MNLIKKYIRRVIRLSKKNPQQIFLLAYNLGIFSWIEANIGGFFNYKRYLEGNFFISTAVPYIYLILSLLFFLYAIEFRKTKKSDVIIVIIIGIAYALIYIKMGGLLGG